MWRIINFQTFRLRINFNFHQFRLRCNVNLIHKFWPGTQCQFPTKANSTQFLSFVYFRYLHSRCIKFCAEWLPTAYFFDDDCTTISLADSKLIKSLQQYTHDIKWQNMNELYSKCRVGRMLAVARREHSLNRTDVVWKAAMQRGQEIGRWPGPDTEIKRRVHTISHHTNALVVGTIYF